MPEAAFLRRDLQTPKRSQRPVVRQLPPGLTASRARHVNDSEEIPVAAVGALPGWAPG